MMTNRMMMMMMMVERWKRESINGEGESGHTGGFCVK